MKKLAIATVLALSVLGLMVAPAGAGRPQRMEATPNPAMVGDSVTVSNVAEDASTCEHEAPPAADAYSSLVLLEIVAPDSTETYPSVVPDASGNWSYMFTADQVGTYLVYAECVYDDIGDTALPAAYPEFTYVELPIVVQQAPDTTTTTTSSDTDDTSGEMTTTTAAAAVAASPRYTG